MVEDLRFESAGGVEPPVKMPGYLTPMHSTHFWIGWQQENQVEKPIARDGVSVMQACRKPDWKSGRAQLVTGGRSHGGLNLYVLDSVYFSIGLSDSPAGLPPSFRLVPNVRMPSAGQVSSPFPVSLSGV